MLMIMGQIDDDLQYKDRRNGSSLYFVDGGVYTGKQLRDKDRDMALQNYFNTHSASNITSRDQIVNPVALLSQMSYGNSAKERKRYNEDLAKLEELQKQQQASYDEWYNSPEQQAIRDREAGLNPDLVGLSGSGTEQTPVGGADPLANVPSNGDIFSQIASGASSLFSAATSLAGLPVQFKQSSLLSNQLKGQQLTNDALQLGNISAFEQIASKGISDKFATFHAAETAAGRAVDVASWFADDNNFTDILQSYAPSDDPRYQHALNRVRKGSEAIIAQSYATNNQKLTNQSNFARNLANPYTDPDTLVMSAAFEPIANAIFELEKQTADFQKMVNDTKMQYMEGLDPTGISESFNQSQAYDALLKGHQAVIEGAKRYAYENLKATYELYPNEPAGEKALALLMGHYPSGLEQFLVSYVSGLIHPGVTPDPSHTNPPAFTGATPGSNVMRGFIPPGSVGF